MDVTDRGVSSVLDATLFALFVGGAIVTLTLPAAPVADQDRSDAVADTLATTTAEVEYALSPHPGGPCADGVEFPWTEGPSFRRTAHGTLAEHLATAAVGAVSIDGQQVTHTYDEFTAATVNATRNATRGRRQQVAVRAVWEPYHDAPVGGTVTVGPTPPPTADVHAATLTVDSGMPAVRSSARAVARNDSFERVAQIVADGVVRGLFPPSATRHALLADYPVNRLTDHRYRRFGRRLGTDTSEFVAVGANERNVSGANTRLRRVLTARFEADMRARFDDPEAAAQTVSVGDVTITIRTWSP